MPITAAQLQVVVGSDISGATKGLDRVNKAIGSTGGFFAHAASTALGFAAATTGLDALGGVGDLVQGALGVGLASQLEETTAQFTALTGSGDQAASILADVRKEADSTPFSFLQLADAAKSLLPAAKQSGTALFDLIHPAEILASLNPAQGLGGAGVALREAMGGDWTSLAERFDLPRQRINALRTQGVPALQIISTVLGEAGASMSLVAARAQTTAGRLNTFQDLIAGIELQAGKPILAALGGELDRFSGIITTSQPGLDSLATTIGTKLGDGLHRAGEELGILIVTAQNFQKDNGLSPLDSAFASIEQRTGEVFGPTAQGDVHKLFDTIKTDGQWVIDNGPLMFGEMGRDLHIAVTWADNLTRALNDINAAGTKVRETIATILGVRGQPTIAERVATGGGIGLGAPGGPGAAVTGEAVNIPGVPGNLFPGGPIFAGPGAPTSNVTVNVTGNNIDSQVDVDNLTLQIAEAVAAGQRRSSNNVPGFLLGSSMPEGS